MRTEINIRDDGQRTGDIAIIISSDGKGMDCDEVTACSEKVVDFLRDYVTTELYDSLLDAMIEGKNDYVLTPNGRQLKTGRAPTAT